MRGERGGRRPAGGYGNVAATILAAPRIVKAVAALLAAVILLAVATLLLSAQDRGSAVSAATAPRAGLTHTAAMRAFDSYVTAEHVALANRNELLALSLVTDGAYGLTGAEFQAAGSAPLPEYNYGKPTLYVPKLTTYPHWFMAAVSQTPVSGGRSSRARTVMLVFDQSAAGVPWALDGTVPLSPGTLPPPVTVGSSGYATPLPSYTQALKASPDVVGALQAAIVDGGPASEATAAVAAGPQTTGLYRTYAAAARQASALHESYSWQMYGIADPVLTLRTADGGGLVYYTMTLETLAKVGKTAASSRSFVPPIPIPTGFRPLLPVHQRPIHHKLETGQTLQYLALVPPATAHAAKIHIIGAAGGPTGATAT